MLSKVFLFVVDSNGFKLLYIFRSSTVLKSFQCISCCMRNKKCTEIYTLYLFVYLLLDHFVSVFLEICEIYLSARKMLLTLRRYSLCKGPYPTVYCLRFCYGVSDWLQVSRAT